MYIGLTSHDKPTVERWRSFGWTITGAIDSVRLGTTTLYRYSVSPADGHPFPEFPIDMLRYDRAYPASQRDSQELVSCLQRRTMMLCGVRVPEAV